jgi:hypothetical protein
MFVGKNVKKLSMFYTNQEKIWSKLEAIEILQICHVPNIQWPRFNNLHTLKLESADEIHLKDILSPNITSLDLQFRCTLDMAYIAIFSNITKIHLYGYGTGTHIDSLLSMPHLQDLNICINVNKEEETMLRKWEISDPQRVLKALFKHKIE